jgi:hypothetical protein
MEASIQQSIANMAHFEASRMYHTQEVARQIRKWSEYGSETSLNSQSMTVTSLDILFLFVYEGTGGSIFFHARHDTGTEG